MDLQRFVDSVGDPAVGVGDGRVRIVNDAARELLDVETDPSGKPVEELFGTDPDLAARYEDALQHYSDVGGVVEDGRRHFVPGDDTVVPLVEGDSFAGEASDRDFGVFVDGDLRYFHLRRSDVSDLPGDSDSLVVFREVTDLKNHERDLEFLRQVVSRILRHNLRNNLMVASGYAATLQEHDDPEVAELGTKIRSVSEDLLETGQKARTIQDAIKADDTIGFDLRRVVREAVESVAEEYDGEYVVDVPDERVEVNPEFPEAIEDTVENGIRHNRGDRRRVRVTGDRDGPWVFLSVIDDGPGIPDDELEALVQRGETKLKHGSGAGLWLTHTVVEESGGDITYDVDETGTTIRMRLPAADR